MPSALKFGGDKASWPIFRKKFLAWCSVNRLDKFLLQALPSRSAAGAGSGASASASAAAAGAAKSEQFDAAADAKAAEKWRAKAGLVYAQLIMVLTGPQLETLVTVSADGDAHALWASLLAKFESKTVANQSQLWSTFNSMRMEAGESIGAYATRLLIVVNQLRGLQAAVDPSQVKHVLLSGVSTPFLHYAEVLQMDKAKDFDELVRDLEEIEERMLNRQARDGDGEQANFSRTDQRGNGNKQGGQQRPAGQQQYNRQRGGGQQQQQGSRPKGPCFNCDQMGHIAFDCPKLPKDAKKCTNCRSLGHVDRQCTRQKRGGNYGNRQQQQQQQQPAAQQNGSGGAPAGSQPAFRAEDDDEYDDNDVGFGAIEEQQAMSAQMRARYAAQTAAGSKVIIAWLDSGASLHTFSDDSQLSDVQTVSPSTRINIADGGVLEVRKRGQLSVALGQAGRAFTLFNVACDPRLVNLVSVGCLTDAGYTVNFEKTEAVVRRTDSGKIAFTAEKVGRTYVLAIVDGILQQQQRRSKQIQKAVQSSGEQALLGAVAAGPEQLQPAEQGGSSSSGTEPWSTVDLWHHRLGHVHHARLQQLSTSGAVHGLPRLHAEATGPRGEVAETACRPCALGKKHRHEFASKRSEQYQRATMPGERLFTDLSGRIMLHLAEGHLQLLQSTVCPSEYLSVIVDEATGLLVVWGLTYKSDAADRLMKWLRQLMKEKGSGVPVEIITDGGGEYREGLLKEFIGKHGIQHKPTQDHTQQHNAAERYMRTIFEMARCMLQAAKLPPVFWLLACTCAAWLLNRTRLVERRLSDGKAPTHGDAAASAGAGVPQPTHVTPYEAFTGARPSLKHVRQFGCDAYVHVPDALRTKLDAKSLEGIHVGYSPYRANTWRILVLSTGKVIESRDVSFVENAFTFRGEVLQQAMGWAGHIDSEEDREGIVDSLQFERDTRAAINASRREAQRQRRLQELHPPEERKEEEEKVSQPAAEAAVQAAGPGVSERSPAAVEASRSSRSVALKPGVQPQAAAAASAPAAETAAAQGSSSAAGVQPVQAPSSSSEPASDVRRSGRDRGAKPNYTGEKVSTTYFTAALSAAEQEQVSGCAGEVSDPTSYRDAMTRSESEGWHSAMLEEMSAHSRNGTWELVEVPPGANVIGGKWVLKTKYKQSESGDGGLQLQPREVLRRKARYVAQGFRQKAGIDFSETFAPTLKYVTLRVMLALAAVLGLLLKQLDVTTAYLQAPMHEAVYMRQPEGFEDRRRPDAVCLLRKSLYGTKQAGHNWNQEVNTFITQQMGYTRTQSDPCLYWRRSATGDLMLLGIFVDDVLHAHAEADDAEWCKLKAKFVDRYPSTDGGDVDVLLGMRITRDRASGALRIDQRAYVQQMLKQFGMEQCKHASTPAAPGVRLQRRASGDGAAEPSRLLQYQQLVGSLLYAAITTRADIMHSVAQLTRFMSNPGEEHWEAARHVLRYLAGSIDVALHYRFRPDLHSSGAGAAQPTSTAAGQQFTALVWCDADWAQCEESRRSTTGVLVQLFGCSVLWMSKRQPTVSLSSTEAEYMALGQGVREMQWIHSLLAELQLRSPQQVAPSDDEPVAQLQEAHRVQVNSSEQGQSQPAPPPSTLLTDNQAAEALVHQRGAMAARSKHIDVRHHHIREIVLSGAARVQWVPTAEQLADVFTKSLERVTFNRLRGVIMGEGDANKNQEAK